MIRSTGTPFSSRRRRSVSILRCWYKMNDAAAAQAVFELLLCLQVALPGLLKGRLSEYTAHQPSGASEVRGLFALRGPDPLTDLILAAEAKTAGVWFNRTLGPAEDAQVAATLRRLEPLGPASSLALQYLKESSTCVSIFQSPTDKQ